MPVRWQCQQRLGLEPRAERTFGADWHPVDTGPPSGLQRETGRLTAGAYLHGTWIAVLTNPDPLHLLPIHPGRGSSLQDPIRTGKLITKHAHTLQKGEKRYREHSADRNPPVLLRLSPVLDLADHI